MDTTLSLLHVEDSPLDAEIIEAEICTRWPAGRVELVSSKERIVDLLQQGNFDLVLSDFSLPGFDGQEVLELVRQHRPDLPFILVSGAMGEERAVEMMKNGVTDYVLKNRLSRLVPAIERALQERSEHDKRLAAEAQLKKSELELRTLTDHLPDIISRIDRQHRHLFVNRAVTLVTGIPVEEYLGKTNRELGMPEELVRYWDEKLDAAFTSGQEQMLVFPFEAHGGPHWFESRIIPEFDPDGVVVSVLGIARDITERKQAEDELQKKNAEIEQFIYTVSHDLRSPLVTVKTFMGYLEKDMAEGNRDDLAQDIQYIHGAADKMKLLLDELLELSRIGRIETTPVKASLREILTETLDILAGLISEHKADIRIPDTDLMLFGDRPRLCQIWQNLIENAVRYRCDGKIPHIELGLRHKDGESVFFVKDDGIGIEPQYHSKIFGIFEQLNPKSPGAGLGLSMVKRIVEKCGGRVWVESEGLGKGSCFRFTLPKAMIQT